jgi:hypothetical protein
MQKLFFFLALFLVAAPAFAQSSTENKTKTYYARDLSSNLDADSDLPKILEIRRSPKQAAGQQPRLPVHKWVKVFDPSSQKLLATIRLLRVRMPYRYSYQYDSSFVLLLHSKEIYETFAFDDATKTLTHLDSTGLKTSSYTFQFGQGKNRCILRYFYKNGKISSEYIYEDDYFASAFSNLDEDLNANISPSISDKMSKHITSYFYNGKPYWSADIITKNYNEDGDRFYKNMAIYDSTGKKLISSLYYNPQKPISEKQGVWLDFHTNGRLRSITDYLYFRNIL